MRFCGSLSFQIRRQQPYGIVYSEYSDVLRPQARSQDSQGGGVLFGEKVDLKPKEGGGGSHLGKMWTFVLYPMEPLAQGLHPPTSRLRTWP